MTYHYYNSYNLLKHLKHILFVIEIKNEIKTKLVSYALALLSPLKDRCG